MSRTVADEISGAIDRRIGTLVESMWESLEGCSYDHRYVEQHAATAVNGLDADVRRILGFVD